uniref:ShKT domain-containing protein n=1 Tax=Ditylenchus dipsaci TaxID=166011 RepID=A0A915EB09_9BILA
MSVFDKINLNVVLVCANNDDDDDNGRPDYPNNKNSEENSKKSLKSTEEDDKEGKDEKTNKNVLLILMLTLNCVFSTLIEKTEFNENSSKKSGRGKIDDTNNSDDNKHTDLHMKNATKAPQSESSSLSDDSLPEPDHIHINKTIHGNVQDLGTNCGSLLNLCEHTLYRTSMARFCTRTCSGSDNQCLDKRPDLCPFWLQRNFCQSTFYSATMKIENCARSCKLCPKSHKLVNLKMS